MQVLSFQQNEILRSKSSKKEYACGRYYNTLKFQCQFPEIAFLKSQGSEWPGVQKELNGIFEVGPNDQGAPGTVMCFAYALPYTYSDLLNDIENCKNFLLSHGGVIVNEQHAKKQP